MLKNVEMRIVYVQGQKFHSRQWTISDQLHCMSGRFVEYPVH